MSPLVTTLLWNTLLAGGLALAVYGAQRLRWLKWQPGVWYSLWLLVLLKLVTPPVFMIPVTVQPDVQNFQATAGPGIPLLDDRELNSLPPGAAAEDSPAAAWSLAPLGIAVSIAGTIALLTFSLVRTRRISRLVRLANPGPPWLQELAERTAREIGIRRRVSLLCVDGCVSPFLWVTRGGPVVVMPSDLVAKLEQDALGLIARHELSHYARRDHWTNAFSLTVVTLLWWNPIAWWARRELGIVQELCCDAAVLASDMRQRRRYAETLLQTLEYVASEDATPTAPAAAFGSCKTFKRRIEMISRKDLSNRAHYVAQLVVLPLGLLLVATSPTLAQEAAERGEELEQVRREIRELRESVDDLKSMIERFAKRASTEDRREERDRDDDREGRLSREKLKWLAEKANLNGREAETLFGLAERVDFNARQFERLMRSDDLSDAQASVMRKLARSDRDEEEREENHEDDRDEDHDEDRDVDRDEDRRER